MKPELHTIEVGGCLFPTSPITSEQDNEARNNFKTCARRERKLFKRLQSVTPASKLFNVYADQYFHSPAVRFFSIIAQAKKLKARNRLTPSEYLKLADEFSLYQPIDEVVEFWTEPKSSGAGFRILHDFGPKYRAAQYMIMRVLSVVFKPKPFQFSIAKRGTNEAIKEIMAGMENGYRKTLTLDIADYFGSFTQEGLLAALPLSEAVIKNVIIPAHVNFKPKKGGMQKKKHMSTAMVHHYYNNHSLMPCPPMLSQGSLCSSIVAEFIVSQMCIQMPNDITMLVYVDDICILASNDNELDKAKCALLTALSQSTAGNFKLNDEKENRWSNAVAFLGYIVRMYPYTTKAHAEPSSCNNKAHNKNCAAIERRIRKLKNGGEATDDIRTELIDYMRYRISWLSAFHLSYDLADRREHALKRVALLSKECGVDIEDVKKSTNQNFDCNYTKTPKNKGGYTYKVKISEIAKVLEPVS